MCLGGRPGEPDIGLDDTSARSESRLRRRAGTRRAGTFALGVGLMDDDQPGGVIEEVSTQPDRADVHAAAMAATWRWSVPQQPPITCNAGRVERRAT